MIELTFFRNFAMVIHMYEIRNVGDEDKVGNLIKTISHIEMIINLINTVSSLTNE